MTAPTWTMRLADMLARELRQQLGEQWSAAIDEGLGMSAVAAIMATPAGPARAVEASLWVRRLHERGLDTFAYPLTGDTSDEEIDAYTELCLAHRRAS